MANETNDIKHLIKKTKKSPEKGPSVSTYYNRVCKYLDRSKLEVLFKRHNDWKKELAVLEKGCQDLETKLSDLKEGAEDDFLLLEKARASVISELESLEQESLKPKKKWMEMKDDMKEISEKLPQLEAKGKNATQKADALAKLPAIQEGLKTLETFFGDASVRINALKNKLENLEKNGDCKNINGNLSKTAELGSALATQLERLVQAFSQLPSAQTVPEDGPKRNALLHQSALQLKRADSVMLRAQEKLNQLYPNLKPQTQRGDEMRDKEENKKERQP